MTKCKCECTCGYDKKKCCSNCCKPVYVEEHKYLFAKEMYQHYQELYEVALGELKFKSLSVDHLLSILEEVVVLLQNERPGMVIAKVIDNGIERYNIDRNIHNSMIGDGQYNFGDIMERNDIDDEEFEYEDDEEDDEA